MDEPTSELNARLAEAAEARQRYEFSYSKARGSHRPEHYEAALMDARHYANIVEGIIARHVRMLVTEPHAVK